MPGSPGQNTVGEGVDAVPRIGQCRRERRPVLVLVGRRAVNQDHRSRMRCTAAGPIVGALSVAVAAVVGACGTDDADRCKRRE